MEFLPEDPTKRKITFAVLAVIVLGGATYVYFTFFANSAPATVEEAIQAGGGSIEEPKPDPVGVRSRGGARSATQGN